MIEGTVYVTVFPKFLNDDLARLSIPAGKPKICIPLSTLSVSHGYRKIFDTLTLL